MFNLKQNSKFNWSIAATSLAISGLALNFPAMAASVPSTYLNDYRYCSARLLALNVSADSPRFEDAAEELLSTML